MSDPFVTNDTRRSNSWLEDPATPKTVSPRHPIPSKNTSGFFCLIAILIATMSSVGCTGFSAFRLRQPNSMASVPKPKFSQDPQMEEVVDHLNRNVDKLHAWRANRVKIRANNLPGLSGSLVVEEGQHLRMVVQSPMGHEVDMGSNNEVFWIWAKRMEPAYVYCRHEQIDIARQSLGVPFEPQWLMQALGVAPIETRDLTMQIDPTGRQARLVQPLVTAHGQPLQKVMVVDLAHGVVTEHCIYDARGQKIAQARLEDFRKDKASGAVLPHRVRLDWPQNQMSLVMNMGEVDVNPAGIPAQIWEMPEMKGVQVVDLGRVGDPGVSRVAAVVDDFRQGSPQMEDPTADDEAGRVHLTLDDAEDEVPINRAINVRGIEHQTTPIQRPANPGKAEWFDE